MATVSALFLQDARRLWDAGSRDEAIQLLKEGIQIYPEYVTAYVVLAQFYKEQHLLDEAAAIAGCSTTAISSRSAGTQPLSGNPRCSTC